MTDGTEVPGETTGDAAEEGSPSAADATAGEEASVADEGAPVATILAGRGRRVGAVVRYEAGKRVRGTLVVTGLFVALAALDLAAFPSIEQTGVDLDEYLRNLPPIVQAMFGEVSLTTIEGFLVAEFYQFAWVLAFGLYLAYLAGGMVAGDVERDRMDVLLATPLSRAEVVVGKYLSLVPMVAFANAVVAVVLYVGVGFVGESLSAVDLLAVHLLSVPYLLACAALGILVSTVASRADTGQRAAMGVVFAMFMLESMAEVADLAVVRALTFQRYYDTAPVLTRGEYDLGGAAVLLGAAAALLGAAVWWFGRRDV